MLLASGDRFGLLLLRKPVKERAANRAMLDVGRFVDPEETQRLLVANPVAVDQPFDLGAGHRGKLALIGIKRAQPRCVGAARERAEGVDQYLGFGVERLAANPPLGLA